MIGYLSGKIHRTTDAQVIIDVNGVGYDVFLAKDILLTLGEVGTDVRLEIYSHINESTFQLYGFRNVEEKRFFQRLISVSGVGPKLALSIISAMPINKLVQALCDGNLVLLTSISGVGKKTAERIVMELKDKLKNDKFLLPLPPSNDDSQADSRLSDVAGALVSLGYQEHQARKVVGGLTVNAEDTVQSLIKKSLIRLQIN